MPGVKSGVKGVRRSAQRRWRDQDAQLQREVLPQLAAEAKVSAGVLRRSPAAWHGLRGEAARALRTLGKHPSVRAALENREAQREARDARGARQAGRRVREEKDEVRRATAGVVHKANRARSNATTQATTEPRRAVTPLPTPTGASASDESKTRRPATAPAVLERRSGVVIEEGAFLTERPPASPERAALHALLAASAPVDEPLPERRAPYVDEEGDRRAFPLFASCAAAAAAAGPHPLWRASSPLAVVPSTASLFTGF
jgi:hypothetical protein